MAYWAVAVGLWATIYVELPEDVTWTIFLLATLLVARNFLLYFVWVGLFSLIVFGQTLTEGYRLRDLVGDSDRAKLAGITCPTHLLLHAFFVGGLALTGNILPALVVSAAVAFATFEAPGLGRYLEDMLGPLD